MKNQEINHRDSNPSNARRRARRAGIKPIAVRKAEAERKAAEMRARNASLVS